METRQAYVEKMMGMINKWRADIQKIKDDPSKHSNRNSQDISDLESEIAEAEKTLDKISQAGDDKWVDLREGVDSSWDNLTTRMDEFSS
ncbi:MAG: hypothetical protein LAT57_06625 [Balneolales bacterium]|nr:hypothetical protein [Balneolales bacterium]